MTRVVALVPARNEAGTVAATVRALRSVVDDVVVVDDGSRDATASEALGAGATVLRVPGRAGKGRAVEGALRRLDPADIWLFADADLGRTAAGLGVLVEVVRSGSADLAIAAFPPQAGGGFGVVKRWARVAIRRLAGFEATEPLSGQRALTDRCVQAVRPFAAGFGLETAMTVDAARKGFGIVEIPIDGLAHRATGRGVRGFVHRGRQGLDIALAVARRALARG